MIRATFKIRYGFKDFQNHMGISANTTLMGMLRRTLRKYPRTAKTVKTVSTMGSFYFIMMNFIPGSDLPFQKSIKISILNLYEFNHTVLSSSLRVGTITFSILILKPISLESIRSCWLLSICRSLICSSQFLPWRRFGRFMNSKKSRWLKMHFGIYLSTPRLFCRILLGIKKGFCLKKKSFCIINGYFQKWQQSMKESM